MAAHSGRWCPEQLRTTSSAGFSGADRNYPRTSGRGFSLLWSRTRVPRRRRVEHRSPTVQLLTHELLSAGFRARRCGKRRRAEFNRTRRADLLRVHHHDVREHPDPPSASVAGRTLDDSTHEWCTTPFAQL